MLKYPHMNKKYPTEYLVWDLETSGLQPGFDVILEIGCIAVIDGKIVEKNFPNIEGVAPKYLPVLRDILKNVINTNSTFSYSDAQCIEITSGTDFFKLMGGLAFKPEAQAKDESPR